MSVHYEGHGVTLHHGDCRDVLATITDASVHAAPPGGTVLEPFAGSGTTVEACIAEGFQCIAIEKGDEYLPLIRERIRRATELPEAAELTRATDQAQAIAEQVAGQLDIFGEETA